MLSRSRTRWMVTAAALLAASVAGTGQIAAQASTAAPQAAQGTQAQQTASYGPGNGDWPRQVYAPYYESWESGGIAQSAAQSGSPYETIAFIQAPAAGSCSLTWNGDSTEPIPGISFAADIATLQRHGGNVIASFGGYGADSGGTEIADSCTDVGAIAADYEAVLTTYHLTGLDMDVEAGSLTNTAGISRRNEAIKLVEERPSAPRRRPTPSWPGSTRRPVPRGCGPWRA